MSVDRLFEQVAAEHEACRKLFGQIGAVPPRDLAAQLWKELVLHHHDHEDRLLLPRVAGHPACREGGPFCTLYFDSFMMNAPLSKAESATGQKVTMNEDQKKLHILNSPANIPLEEHLAMRLLLDTVLNQQMDDTKAESLLKLCQSIALRNFEKEEMCFSKLCARTLDPAQAATILAEWTN